MSTDTAVRILASIAIPLGIVITLVAATTLAAGVRAVRKSWRRQR